MKQLLKGIVRQSRRMIVCPITLLRTTSVDESIVRAATLWPTGVSEVIESSGSLCSRAMSVATVYLWTLPVSELIGDGA